MRRASILGYAIASYAISFLALIFLVLAAFGVLDPWGELVRVGSPWLGALLDVALALAFALQHSVMARASFKERWRLHPALERATYMLATGIALLALVVLWQPLPGNLWAVRAPLGRGLITGVAVMGWAYLLLASFAIDHFELFGLKQAWRAFRGQTSAQVPFRERWMYRFDRHPIMTGFLVGLWATPQMTYGHLLLAALLSVYIVVGVHFEERALRRQLGETYEAYRRRVPAIVPVYSWKESP